MNSDINNIAGWARSQGWRVEDDSKGYTRFYDPGYAEQRAPTNAGSAGKAQKGRAVLAGAEQERTTLTPSEGR